ncbi:MAG: hypothetical protein ACUVRG_05705, partial [Ignavibacterium sp.]
NSEFGTTSGIHWHMNINNKVEYIHTDEIPWVKLITSDGKEIIYRNKEENFDEKNFKAENYRRMDCID